jgi:hypothetical protein
MRMVLLHATPAKKKKRGLTEPRPKSGVFGKPFFMEMRLHAATKPKTLSRGTS